MTASIKIPVNIIFIIIIMIFIITPCLGDTIALSDGSLLVGKIVGEDDEKIIFNNAFGLFVIKHNQIVEKHVTEDYREDIKIIKDLGKTYNEKEVKENFDAGLKAKNKITREREMLNARWYSGGIISVNAFYFATTGKMNTVLPAGYYFACAYDNSLDFIIGGKRRLWMPRARIEGGYMIYKKDDSSIAGPAAAIGPAWKFDIIKESCGAVVLAPVTGMAFIKIKHEDKRETSNTLFSNFILGYEYKIGIVTISVQGRYKYIYDRDIDFNGIGGGISAGVSLW